MPCGGQRFGWPQDGWLGLLPQRNAWCDDGHEFFAVRRLLRYLSEPGTDKSVLERNDRHSVASFGAMPITSKIA
jgi:fructosamine-3-kinase